MTDLEWQRLCDIIAGREFNPLPAGFIIDSPWLAGWSGHTVMDYFTDDDVWFEANLRAQRLFPGVLFLPGFWAEYGMCTEPSAFGGKCVWPENEFPFPQKVLADYDEIARVRKPNCRTDGMCPFVIKRLKRMQSRIEAAGHRIRFATARGPMNIATYLLGHSETLIGLRTNPDEIHRLLDVITDFLVDWLRYQVECFPSIDGVLVLDDLIGFVGGTDFEQFVVPYFERIYSAVPATVRALHNDCHGIVTARHLRQWRVNLFNFSFEHSMPQMREACGDSVVLLGNLPPRDVLARGSADDVTRGVRAMVASIANRRRVILSCGGGTPPGVSTENLQAFCDASRESGSA